MSLLKFSNDYLLMILNLLTITNDYLNYLLTILYLLTITNDYLNYLLTILSPL